MKILLVSDQSLRVKNDSIRGGEHFTENLERMSVLGELHLCVTEVGKSNLHVFDDDISWFVKRENVCFIKKSQILPSKETVEILKMEISKVDLVIVYLPSVNAEMAAFLARGLGKPYMTIMIACTWDGLRSQDWKRKLAAPYRFYLNKQILKRADYASYVTHEFFQNRYPSPHARLALGLSDVVLRGVDDSILDRRLKRIESKDGKGVVRLATAGTVNAIYKGQRYVLEALRKLKDRGYENYEYHLIGGGDDSRLRKLSQELDIENQVKFLGAVPHEEVFRLLEDIDIYIQPSLTEGLPRSVVEAMSLGLPCIGSQVGAIPELLEEEMLVRKRSADDIMDRLVNLRDKNVLKKQAERNFSEAKQYECSRLDAIRKRFYEDVRDDMMRRLQRSEDNSHF